MPAHLQAKPQRLVLLGAPGVGKGTQADLLATTFGACHLSTGDIFRSAKEIPVSEQTPALKVALECMSRGQLVPDETVLAMLAERTDCLRCKGGFLLDGFPRTVTQAQALDRFLTRQQLCLDAVLSYELPLEQIIARLSGRRTCSKCKAVYHVQTRAPRIEGVCDHCHSSLYQREDDRPESIRVRMQAYEQSTAPLTQYYQDQQLLLPIPADGAPETIFNRTLSALRSSFTLARNPRSA